MTECTKQQHTTNKEIKKYVAKQSDLTGAMYVASGAIMCFDLFVDFGTISVIYLLT